MWEVRFRLTTVSVIITCHVLRKQPLPPRAARATLRKIVQLAPGQVPCAVAAALSSALLRGFAARPAHASQPTTLHAASKSGAGVRPRIGPRSNGGIVGVKVSHRHAAASRGRARPSCTRARRQRLSWPSAPRERATKERVTLARPSRRFPCLGTGKGTHKGCRFLAPPPSDLHSEDNKATLPAAQSTAEARVGSTPQLATPPKHGTLPQGLGLSQGNTSSRQASNRPMRPSRRLRLLCAAPNAAPTPTELRDWGHRGITPPMD